jgi:small subunit ribosomal protein S20
LPNIKSAIKRTETTKKKNLRNRMIKSNLNTTVKKLEKAVAQGDSAQVEALYREAVSAYDRAGSKGVLHRNAVNRKKAQMAKIISAAN